MSRFFTFVIVLSVFTFCPAVSAQAAPPLSPEIIQGFVDSINELQEIGKKYDADKIVGPAVSGDAATSRTTSPFSAAISGMQGHEAYDEMQATITKYGFADMQSWGAIGDRIMQAYAANSIGAEMPQMDEQMKQALEQIENSNMPEAQKENMKQMMMSSMQMMNSYASAPEADKKAVLPYMSVIENLGEQ